MEFRTYCDHRVAAILSMLLVVLAVKPIIGQGEDLSEALKFIKAQTPGFSQADFEYVVRLNEMEKLPGPYATALKSLSQIASSNYSHFAAAKYRRIDGIANNLRHPLWGSSLHVQRRILPNSYDDGKGVPRHRSSVNSSTILPSARSVSINCFMPSSELEQECLDRYSSQLLWQFGQFIDHDLTLTEVIEEEGCCKGMNSDGTHPDMFNNGHCCPIAIEGHDRFFHEDCMYFVRSVGVVIDDVREQVNGITAYLDLSSIYGSSEAHCAELREFKDGLLQTTREKMLPRGDKFKCVKNDHMPKCPLSGDKRANVIPGLTILHAIFHREHNRVAGKLKEVNPHWDDERLFQEARRIVIAEYQNILYAEFLPKILGTVYNVTGLNQPYEYNPYLDVRISNEFAAAAFRYGHSQVNEKITRSSSEESLMSNSFFRPDIAVSHGERNFKNIIENQLRYFAQGVDRFFTTELTDKLFMGVDAPLQSFDLPARSIQRGRDHGIPPYLLYLDEAISNMGKIEGVTDMYIPYCLSHGIYKSIQDMDLFLGGVYEAHLPGGLVGHTFAYLISEQFKRLKFGDRFFFETQDPHLKFTEDQLASVKTMTLSSILCKCLPKMKKVQPWALTSRRPVWNHMIPCTDFPDLNFELWKEVTTTHTTSSETETGQKR